MQQVSLTEPYPQEWVLAVFNHFHHILQVLTSFPRTLISYSGFFFIWYSFLTFPCEPTWWKADVDYRLNANSLIYSGINRDTKPNITSLKKNMKRNSHSWKITYFPSAPLFFLGVFPYTSSARALWLPQEDTVYGSSKTWPNCSSWHLDFMYVHTQGANIVKSTPNIKETEHHITSFMGLWALERIEECELTELHLLILMNLGDLLSFMEKTSVRKEHSQYRTLEQHYQRCWTHGQTSWLSN